MPEVSSFIGESMTSSKRKRNTLDNDSSTESALSKVIKPSDATKSLLSEEFYDEVRFLVKSEPYEYGIDDLAKAVDCRGRWDGVRNYQARNIMRTMKSGDLVYFYHSNVGGLVGIYGILKIISEGYADPLAQDPKHKTYDSKAKEDPMKWLAFDVELVTKFPQPILLKDIKAALKDDKDCALVDMMLLKNSRLSVQYVTEKEANYLHQMLRSKITS